MGLIGSIFGANNQANASRDAAHIQSDAANRSADLAKQMFDTQQGNIAPWLDAGKSGLGAISAGLANGTFDPRTTARFDASQYTTPQFSFDPSSVTQDPGYQFRMDQGLKALQATNAAQGITGGAAMKDITRYGQNFASNEYQQAYSRARDTYNANAGAMQDNFGRALTTFGTNYSNSQDEQNTLYNRYASLGGVGQTANNQLLNAGQYTTTTMGNDWMSGANATAAGKIGAANAWTHAIDQGNSFLSLASLGMMG